MVAALTTDNAGMCRFNRGWSEKLWPDIVKGHDEVDADRPSAARAYCEELRAGIDEVMAAVPDDA